MLLMACRRVSAALEGGVGAAAARELGGDMEVCRYLRHVAKPPAASRQMT